MRFKFAKKKIWSLHCERKGEQKYPEGVVKAFFGVMQKIDAATDEREIRAFKGHHFEKLETREREYSIRLNKQYRLIFEWGQDGNGKYMLILDIEKHYE
jgi:toxin HigB-1